MIQAGRVALVTGGARRLGREMSLALAEAGAAVVINHSSSPAEADATVREIEARGGRALAVQADVTQHSALERLVTTVEEKFGRLDILVNSASLFESAPVLDIGEEAWDRVLGVNLKAPFFLTQLAAPLLRAAHGVVVNIADLSALQTWPSYVHHAVSKAGLVHLTRQLARALAPEIRVNCIAPGTVLPPAEYHKEDIDREAARTVLKQTGTPADVTRALLYLVESDFVTGEVLVVDGGRILR